MKEMGFIKIITVGNSGVENYPGNFTNEEIEIIKDNIIGKVLHLFSGRSLIGDIRVDFSQNEATIKGDVFEYLKIHQNEEIDTILLDPPYNDQYGKKYDSLNKNKDKEDQKQFVIYANSVGTTELFTLMTNLNPKRIIMKSWQYYNFSKYGYIDAGSYLCYAGGYRKPTFLMICDRNESIKKKYKTKKLDSFLT